MSTQGAKQNTCAPSASDHSQVQIFSSRVCVVLANEKEKSTTPHCRRRSFPLINSITFTWQIVSFECFISIGFFGNNASDNKHIRTDIGPSAYAYLHHAQATGTATATRGTEQRTSAPLRLFRHSPSFLYDHSLLSRINLRPIVCLISLSVGQNGVHRILIFLIEKSADSRTKKWTILPHVFHFSASAHQCPAPEKEEHRQRQRQTAQRPAHCSPVPTTLHSLHSLHSLHLAAGCDIKNLRLPPAARTPEPPTFQSVQSNPPPNELASHGILSDRSHPSSVSPA